MGNKVYTDIMSLFVLFLFLLQLLFANSYDPVDYNLAINCGYSNDTTLNNRNWVADVDGHSKLFSTIEPHSSVKAEALTLPANSLSIPFSSARLSYSNFTYSFPVFINTTVFLRLHFFPTSYNNNNFEQSNALFSVKANNLNLLKQFNPSLWVDQNERTTITKEYCINLKAGEKLNLAFIPSISNHSNANYYAFINAIEILSMPTFLYYTDPNDSLNFKLVGMGSDESSSTSFEIPNDKALEMLYRVNVGNNQVPGGQDTGMFRYWDNDYPRYLQKQYLQSVLGAYALKLDYKKNHVPNYTAPSHVYLSARSYGIPVTETESDNYNVTWNFEVDLGFTYMVRLHFCEFEQQPTIQNVGDRVFQIFIADNLAEQNADVINWSGGNLVPVHRDYAIIMMNTTHGSSESESESERVNLSIKLGLLPETMTTKYRNVILNGIEVFKISDDHNNLAGTNPKPITQFPLLSLEKQLSKKNSKNSIVIIVVVVVSGFFLAFIVGMLITVLVRRRRRRFQSLEEEKSWKRKTKNEGSSTLPSHLCRYFTIAEIKAATNNFDDVFIVGVGGFGNVYKGYIDGSTPVAIKRLKPGSQQGVNEFMNEIELLSQLRHVHLVSLIGYCNDGVEMILVYDFMQRGTLQEYLYGSNNRGWSKAGNNESLSWKQRLEIVLGAARGLHYLHTGAKHNIIHRDVKSTNILLDEKWVAKVSDFGLSKVGPIGMSMTHVSTLVKGSLGYLDPEYYLRQRLTLKSDVYSFGVVLLEVLCGRAPLIRGLDKKKVSLVGWFLRCYDEGVAGIEEIVDPLVKDSITSESLKCYCQVAVSCLRDDGDQRPSMSDVVGTLEFALQLVLEDSQLGETHREGIQVQEEITSDEGSDVRFTSSEDYGSQTSKVSTTSGSATTEGQPLYSSTVFSEIGNPKAR